MKKFLAILAIGLPMIAVGMNFSMVNVSMATLQKEFNAGIAELQWLMNSVGITVSAFMVTMGKWADLRGRRHLYFLGTLLVCIAALGSTFAPKLGWIIACQAIQGLAAAIVIPISQALLSHLYPEERRAQAIGIWGILTSISLGIGPIMAGVILATLSWRWLFFINVPLALLSILLLFRYVCESKSQNSPPKIDLRAVFLLILTIGSLVFSIMQIPIWGWKILWPLAVFFLSLGLFIRLEKRSSSPIIRPDFFFRRTFLLSTSANFCMIFFAWGYFFLFPYYLQKEQGFSALHVGLILLLVTGPMALFSSSIAKLYNKTGPKLLMVVGFLLLGLSSVIQLFFTPEMALLPFLAALSFGIGWVLAWGPSITSAVSSVPLDSAGTASAAFATLQEVGGTLGLTIVGTAFRASGHFASGVLVLLLISLLGALFSARLKVEKK